MWLGRDRFGHPGQQRLCEVGRNGSEIHGGFWADEEGRLNLGFQMLRDDLIIGTVNSKIPLSSSFQQMVTGTMFEIVGQKASPSAR